VTRVARFHYTALSTAGDLIAGELDGPDAAAVLARLHDQALLPISAEEKPRERTRLRAPGLAGANRLPARELALFSQQLARLLKASLPLDRSLAILAALVADGRARRAVGRTLDLVRDGAGLAEAMAAQADAFPRDYVAMIRAGEAGGALQQVLARVAEFLARSEAIRQKVTSALIYPAVLVAVAALSVGLVLTVVLPQFEPVFREAGARLPLNTRVVMAAGDVLRDDWWMVLTGAAIAAAAWQRLMRRSGMARRRDRILLRLPVAGALIAKLELARFSRTLATLLLNGVAAPRALALCAETIGNRVLAEAIETVAARFKEGGGLSGPLQRTGRFPGVFIEFVQIGEETGRLEEMLQEIADLYDQEAQRTLDRLLTLLVPAITIAMGAVIAFIIAAVLSAMISINDLAA
jgi:general secretion pathway protein F